MYKKNILHGLVALLFLSLLPISAYSDVPEKKEYARKDYIYEKPTFAALSQLYWALSKLDSTVDQHIDNFMRINECKIYQNYFYDELEWSSVRKSSRSYILSNIEEFPTRFEIEQPIHFSEYDADQGVFQVWDPYRIENTKLFEVLSPEYQKEVCGVSWGKDIPEYPRGIVMEIPRPISITKIKMSSNIARAYINLKKKELPKSLAIRNKEDVYKARNAFLVLKVKFFAARDDELVENRRSRARLLAALEEINIYADEKRKFLLYSKTYAQREERKTAEELFKARLERIKREKEAAKKKAEKKKD